MSAPSVEEAVRAIMASRYQPAVGDRVRVTAGIAECRCEWGSDMPEGHPVDLLGWAGVVETPSTHLVERSLRHEHPVAVRFSKPFEVAGVVWWGSFFAATELEPEPASAAGGAEADGDPDAE